MRENNKLIGRRAQIGKTVLEVLNERKDSPFPATNVDPLRAEVSSRLQGVHLGVESFLVLLSGLYRRGKIRRVRRGLYAAAPDKTTE